MGNRWIAESLSQTDYREDNRHKIRLVGEIITDAVAKGFSASTIAKEIHSALVSGEIKASGRFRVYPDGEGESQDILVRVYIAPEEFAPTYSCEHYHKCLVIHEDDRKSYFNEWCEFDWLDSSLKYYAWGYDKDEKMTWQRWTCHWSHIMIHPDQAYRILAKAIPSFRRHVRPGYNRPAKTDREILAKAQEMKRRGITAITDIARDIKHEPGFEFVQNTYVRELLSENWS